MFQSAPGAMRRTNISILLRILVIMGFNPRPAQCAGRTPAPLGVNRSARVSIRARRNAPDERTFTFEVASPLCFNPRPAQCAGRTSTPTGGTTWNARFNPRPAQCAGRTKVSGRNGRYIKFQSAPGAMRRTNTIRSGLQFSTCVSIRARRNAPDEPPSNKQLTLTTMFQSAPGAMRRTNRRKAE